VTSDLTFVPENCYLLHCIVWIISELGQEEDTDSCPRLAFPRHPRGTSSRSLSAWRATAQPLLTASHILPWGEDKENCLNPENDLCLNAVHDRAFDRHLM
jgi:hypothetical protein